MQYGLPSETDEWQNVAKVDFTMSEKHSLFGRYIATSQFTPPPFSLEAAEQNLLVTRIGGRDNLAQSFTLGENYVINSGTLNAVRFAYNNLDINRTSTDFFSAPEVGINIYSYMPHYMLLNITGGFQLGGGTESLSTFDTPSWQISDDLTLVRGSHQFAFGGNYASWKSLSLANVRSPGQFTVDGTITGLGLADFMVGRLGTNGFVQAAPNTLDMEQKSLGLYAQDTWRVGPRLTLNYGLRWEPFFPQQLVNGAVYQFDMDRFRAGTKSTVFPNGPAGLYFPGDQDFPSQAGMLTDWNNFGPRVGLAWDPAGDGKTSVRAAYGKSYEFVNAQFHLNTSVAPPWGSEVRLTNPPGGLDNPFLGSPGGQTNIFPVTFDQNAPFSINGPFLVVDQRHGVDQRPLVQRDRRAAARRQVVCVGRLRRQPDEQHLGVDAAQQRAVHSCSRYRCRAERREHEQSPAAQRDRSEQRPVLRSVGPVRERRQPELRRHAAVGARRHAVGDDDTRTTRCRTATARRTAAAAVRPTWGSATTSPTIRAIDDGNCTADRLHNFSLTAASSRRVSTTRRCAPRSLIGGWRASSAR